MNDEPIKYDLGNQTVGNHHYQICPVCSGKGIVPMGYYDLYGGEVGTSTYDNSETCRACDGKGIV